MQKFQCGNLGINLVAGEPRITCLDLWLFNMGARSYNPQWRFKLKLAKIPQN